MRTPDPRFSDQLLVGGFDPLMVTAGFVVAGAVFFAGLAYWGNRFKDLRRTTIILYGLGGGTLLVASALLLNHSGGLPTWALAKKSELIVASFPSQADRDWFAPETFAALARLRGIEAHATSHYAEGFHARKLVL